MICLMLELDLIGILDCETMEGWICGPGSHSDHSIGNFYVNQMNFWVEKSREWLTTSPQLPSHWIMRFVGTALIIRNFFRFNPQTFAFLLFWSSCLYFTATPEALAGAVLEWHRGSLHPRSGDQTSNPWCILAAGSAPANQECSSRPCQSSCWEHITSGAHGRWDQRRTSQGCPRWAEEPCLSPVPENP